MTKYPWNKTWTTSEGFLQCPTGTLNPNRIKKPFFRSRTWAFTTKMHASMSLVTAQRYTLSFQSPFYTFVLFLVEQAQSIGGTAYNWRGIIIGFAAEKRAIPSYEMGLWLGAEREREREGTFATGPRRAEKLLHKHSRMAHSCLIQYFFFPQKVTFARVISKWSLRICETENERRENATMHVCTL